MKCVPAALIFRTKASYPPPFDDWIAFHLGKSQESVRPTTVTFPSASTAMPWPKFDSCPPMHVE